MSNSIFTKIIQCRCPRHHTKPAMRSEIQKDDVTMQIAAIEGGYVVEGRARQVELLEVYLSLESRPPLQQP